MGSDGRSPAMLVRCALVFGGLILSGPNAYPQGCMPAGFIGPALGAGSHSYLEGGQWEAAVYYRYLGPGNGYIGDEIWEAGKEVVARNWIHAIDLQATYAFTPRYDVSLTVPFVHAERSTVLEHDGERHTTRAGGLGDVRLVGHGWLLDPKEPRSGNLRLGLGMKAPTGEDEATGTFHKPTGPEIRPVDQAIQPGDGG